MIKVLYTVNGLRVNGMSAVIMQYLIGLKDKGYEFVIFTDEVAEQYHSIIHRCNAKLITSQERRKNQLAYFAELCSIIRKEKIDIIHAHGNSATIAVEMLAALVGGVKIRVAHSHNTTCVHATADKLLRPLFNMTYTHGIGCGVEAGKWLFGERKHQVIKNGIALEQFAYNPAERMRIRERIKVDDKTCIVGHVGRFTDQKNHEAILRIFKQYLLLQSQSVLLLVGDGPNIDSVKEQADKLGITENVIFYGTTAETAAMYSAMDVFLFPSKFEGVPLTLVEAQASGLPCFISDRISNEVIKTDLVKVLSLDEEKKWAQCLRFDKDKRRNSSERAILSLTAAGFEIGEVIKQVDKLYRTAVTLRR